MEDLLQNGGLCHLGEKIFDYLPDKDLAKCLLVSKLWHSFLTFSAFWKRRWIRKLDLVLAQNSFVPEWGWEDREDGSYVCIHSPKPLCEYYPEWKDICNYMKNNESLANFQLFVTTLEEFSNEERPTGPLETALCRPKAPQNPKLKLKHCPRADEFIKLLLRCPGANFSDSLNIVIGQHEFEKIELLLNHGDKTEINVNSKEIHFEHIELTALHTLAADWLCQPTEPYMKIMFDNAEKYGLDINAENNFGFTPFQLMCWVNVKPPKRSSNRKWSFKNKLDCWLDYPELFTPNNFSLASKEKLVDLIIELHQEKMKSGEGTEDFNEKLNLPKDRKCKKSNGLTKYALRKAYLKKKILVKTIWELYQERIKAYANAKKRAVKVKNSCN